jgi:hypothetical protein
MSSEVILNFLKYALNLCLFIWKQDFNCSQLKLKSDKNLFHCKFGEENELCEKSIKSILT